MNKRKSIAIYFNTDYKQATGLTIYLLNIIRVFNLLDESLKPALTIIYTENVPLQDIKEINYPYCNYYLYKLTNKRFYRIRKLINAVSSKCIKQKFLSLDRPIQKFPRNIDLIYPYYNLKHAKQVRQKIYWKADFQEKYYPDFFPDTDINWSNNFLTAISKRKDILVLSSVDSLNDYKRFYPDFKHEVKLLRFASYLPEFNSVNLQMLLQKYNIEERYFFVANQFWPHKNHIVILKAINHIKSKLNCRFVFSGQTSSYRDPGYFLSLMNYVDNCDLNRHVSFLGFIDRREQLKLMAHSLCVIQPSLFEGWSTVIEDAKAQNKLILSSNISVNQEQVSENVHFFDPHDHLHLSDLILAVQENQFPVKTFDYARHINQFKEDITNIFIR